MHEAHSVIGTYFCVRGEGLPEGDWELDQYLQTIVSAWHLRNN